MASTVSSPAHLYFDIGHGGVNERDSATALVEGQGLANFQELAFPFHARRLYGLRFDALDRPGSFLVREVTVRYRGKILARLPATREVRLKQPIPLSRLVRGSTILLYVESLLVWLAALLLLRVIVGIGRVTPTYFCVAALSILPFVSLAPALLESSSQNPLHYMTDLVNNSKPPVLSGHIWLDPNVGFTTQALGGLSAWDWLHGQIPWWNSYTGVGVPLAAEMQPGSFFLPFVLLLHFPCGTVLLKLTLQVLAGLGTYAFLRELRVDRLAALGAGILFELNGTFAWMGDAPIMPIAFLPLLLWGIELVAIGDSKTKSTWGTALIAVSIAWSLFAGFPETAFLDGLLAMAWAAVRFFHLPPSAARKRRFAFAITYRAATVRERLLPSLFQQALSASRLRFASRVAIGGACGLLFAAPVVLPFLEYQSLSAIQHTADFGGLAKPALTMLLFPYVFGPIGEFGKYDPSRLLNDVWGGIGGYFGCALIYLAIAGLVGRKYRAFRLLLACWILLFVLRTMGVHWCAVLLNAIPGLSLVIARYSLPSMQMAAALLAGLAIDDWRSHRDSRLVRVSSAALGFLALSGLAIWAGWPLIAALIVKAPHYPVWLAYSCISAAAVFLLSGLLLAQRSTWIASAALLAVIAAEPLVASVIPTLAGVRHSSIDRPALEFLERNLGLQRFYTLGPIRPNYGAYFHLPSLNHNSIPIPRNWVSWIHSSLDKDVDASIFVGNTPEPGRARVMQLKEHLAGYRTAAVKYVVAAAWMHACDDSQSIIRGANLPIPELRCVYRDGTLAILELAGSAHYFDVEGGPCQLETQSREEIKTNCRNKARLIRKELFYPGWSARVDGRKQTVTRYGEIFQSIDLPIGATIVRFGYLPSHAGWILACMALAILAIGGISVRRVGDKLSK